MSRSAASEAEHGGSAVRQKEAARRRAQTMLGLAPRGEAGVAGGSAIGAGANSGLVTASTVAARVRAGDATRSRRGETIDELRERFARLMLDDVGPDRAAHEAAEDDSEDAGGSCEVDDGLVVEGGGGADDILAQQFLHGQRLSLHEKIAMQQQRVRAKSAALEQVRVTGDEKVREGIFDEVDSGWFTTEAHSALTAQILRRLPAAYEDDDSDDNDVECVTRLQNTIRAQKAEKARVDRAFRVELLRYQRSVMPCAPLLLDLADALDSSRGACRETAQLLGRSKRDVEASLAIVQAHRRRKHLAAARAVLEQVAHWNQQAHSAVALLDEREYVQAITVLGAELFSEAGSPLHPKGVSFDSPAASEPASPTAPGPPQPAAAAPSRGSAMSDAELTEKFGDAVGRTAAGRAAVRRWLRLREGATELVVGCLRSDLAAMLSGAPLASSPIPADLRAKLVATTVGDGSAEGEGLAGEDHCSSSSGSGGGSAGAAAMSVSAEDGAGAEADDLDTRWDAVSDSELARGTRSAADPSTLAAPGAEPSMPLQQFDAGAFLLVLQALYALRVRGDSLPRFILDSVEVLIDSVMRAALVQVVGDAGRTWEAIVDTLVPSEFHCCTVALLAALTTMLRSVLAVRTFCISFGTAEAGEGGIGGGGGEQQHSGGEPGCEDPGEEGVANPQSVLLSSCRALSSIGDRAAQKCLAAVVAYALRARLTRAPLADVLHVYRLLMLFVEVCCGASSDGAAVSTRSALQFQCARVLHNEFAPKAADDLMKVVRDDTFLPFPASADDFTDLRMYVERAEEAEINMAIRRFLTDGASDHELRFTTNPFHSPVAEQAYTPALPEGPQLQLFDSGIPPLFTFSSFMTCKWMFDFVASSQGLPALATELLEIVNYLASVYVWFIVTHFIAASEHTPLEEEHALPMGLRGHLSAVHQATLRAAPVPGFPVCAGASCHGWKQRAADPQQLYACQERATAICSIDTIVAAHRLCLQAVSPLLPAETMGQYANFTEALSTVARHCVRTGVRRIAQNLLGHDQIAAAIERVRWDQMPAAFPCSREAGSPSSHTLAALEQLRTVHRRLRDAHRDLPTVALGKVVMNMVFNVFVGFVEGCSRVKKLGAAGGQQLLADMHFLSKMVKDEHPTTPQRLLDYCASYVSVLVAGGGGPHVNAFIHESHANYSFKQLMGLVEREGFMRRREVEALIKSLHHEDRTPLSLLDGAW